MSTFDQFLKKAVELRARDQSFAIATVVRYVAPISGKPGDKAIIFADGKMWGWIGGGCSQPAVVSEALKALQDGRPRLVRISPSKMAGEEGFVGYTMTCHSGGALDIYIEPVLPKPHIVILGRSPVAKALAELATVIGYAISVAPPEADERTFANADGLADGFDLSGLNVTLQTFIVVSTQGEHDEEAMEQALRTKARYVAFVASKPKARRILEYLREKGIGADRLERVHAPAGLDLKAGSPEEIAVSILAEIVQVKASADPIAAGEPPPPVMKTKANDPICGMLVNTNEARYKSEYRGQQFYFCCAACQQSFEKEPERYVAAL